jgi:hypothetical protein
MHGDLNPIAMPGQMLVDGIVEDLGDAVVKSALIGSSDVHSGLLAHRLEAFEGADL